MKKKLDKIYFLIICFLIIFGGLVKPILKSTEINYSENRTAVTLPTFSLKSFQDKSYQNTFEDALADQIPLSDVMKQGQKLLDIIPKMIYTNFNTSFYNPLGSGVYYNSSYFLYSPYDFNSIQTALDNKVTNINNAVNRVNKVDFYLYYIEKDTDINFETNTKTNIYNYIIKDLDKKVKKDNFTIDNFNEYKEKFYKTDHHWNYNGSYKAYSELATLMTKDKPINIEETRCLNVTFRGSKTASLGIGALFREEFCSNIYNFKNHDVYINNQKAESYGDYGKVLNGEITDINYGTYYGWDYGLLKLDFHQPNKDNLLIIGESYDNAINELIASHFNITYNIDLRNYETDMKEKFNLESFVKKNNIKKVLLIGNVDYYTLSTFNI